jgi:hypothetical protein
MVRYIFTFILLVGIILSLHTFLDTTHRGSIASAQALEQLCGQGQQADIPCYQKELQAVASNGSLAIAIATLEQLQETEERLRDCHTLAHKIAGYAIRQHPETWEKLLQNTSAQACSSGFFHGILEGHLASDPTFSIDKNSIEIICQSRSSKYEQGSCAHGLGHLALVERDDNVENSLPVCELSADHLTEECYSGIYMEHMVRTNLIDHGLAPTPQLDEKYGQIFAQLCMQNTYPLGQIACWGEMGYLYAGLAKDNPQELWNRCQNAKGTAAIENCFLTGIQKIAVTSEQDQSVAIACEATKANSDLHTQCLGRIIDTSLTTSPSFLPRALLVCSTQPTEADTCYTTLINTLQTNRSRYPQTTCDRLPEDHRQQCKKSLEM